MKAARVYREASGQRGLSSDQRRKEADRAAFTLVELLLVIAVLAVLVAILFPLAGRTVQRSKEASCLANLRQIGLAAFLYAGEHQSRLPPGKEEEVLWFNLKRSWLGKYTRATSSNPGSVLRCPSDQTGSPVGDYQFYYSYGWNSHFLQVHAGGSPAHGRSFSRLSEAAGKILFADGLSHIEDPAGVPKYPFVLTAENVEQRLSRRHRRGVQALFGDGRALWLSREEAVRPAFWKRELDAI